MKENEPIKDVTPEVTEDTTASRENVEHKRPRANTRKALALTLWLSIWGLFLTSCDTTQADVVKQEEKTIVMWQEIEQYVKYRKGKVKEYNELVRLWKADPKNNALKIQKAELRDEIKKTDKKIEKLWKKYIKQTKKYNETVIKSLDGRYWNGDTEIPENTYDFLLRIIELWDDAQ